MKNIIIFGSFLSMILLTNCSGNDSLDIPNTNQSNKVLSKVTITSYDNPSNPQVSTSELIYNNGRLHKIILDNGGYSLLEYDTSGKVSKQVYYESNNSVDYNLFYTYNGDQLLNAKAVYTNPTSNRISSYVYNNAGQLVSSTLCQSEPCTNTHKNTYTYNGNNVSIEIWESTSGLSYATKREFTYDNMKNPYTNINKYVRFMMEGAYALSENNYKTEKISYRDNSGVWIENQNITYEIQYNDDQLPTQVLGKEANGSNYVKYNYEYISL